MKEKVTACPCGSGVEYGECCGRYHGGMAAVSALELMRSRYSAYALGKWEYILATTWRGSKYFERDREAWRRGVEEFSRGTEFLGLEVVEWGEDWVWFRARLRQGGKEFVLEERSRFVKEGERWFYDVGEVVIR